MFYLLLRSIELLRIVPTLRVVTNEPIFRNVCEISKFPASLDMYRGVINIENFEIESGAKCFRSSSLCFPWAGNKALQYPLSTARVLQDPS